MYTFQDTFEHTARRLLQIPRIKRRLERIIINCSGGKIEIIFYFKYGFDVSILILNTQIEEIYYQLFLYPFQGTTVPDQFKQAWKDDEDEEIDTTGHVLISSTVPIQMLAKYEDKNTGKVEYKIIYQNFLVNSAFSVRPLHFWKVKESREKTQMEAARLREEVKNIIPLDITPEISVKMHGYFSMMDSKVCTGKYLCLYSHLFSNLKNVLQILDVLDSAFQRCVLCGLTGPGMTSLDAIFHLDPNALEMICLCILHFGLRIFSFLLKLGYHKTFKVFCFTYVANFLVDSTHGKNYSFFLAHNQTREVHS